MNKNHKREIRLLYVVNKLEFFLSHRLPVAIAAKKNGYDVHIATMPSVMKAEVEKYGFTHHSIHFTRRGKNIIRELFVIFSLMKLFKNLQPDLIHLVTIKPVLYGGIAARFTKMPAVIAAIPGLGYIFSSQKITTKLTGLLVVWIYRFALKLKNLIVIFQNESDRSFFLDLKIIPENQTELIPGSGVDLNEFTYNPEPPGKKNIVMASRLLRGKGVFEFFEAADIIKERGIKAEFYLAGEPDTGNPESVSEAEIQRWNSKGSVIILGYQKDIATLFSQSHIVVFPSYYGEGLPKVLIEASASGRPVVTTNNPGCEASIISGKTGLTVPVKSSEKLADAIQILLEDDALRVEMGRASREFAEKQFDIKKVIQKHLEIYNQLLCFD